MISAIKFFSMNKLYPYLLILILSGCTLCCNNTNNIPIGNVYENIDLFTVIYNRALISFQVDSTGKVLEFKKENDNIKLYNYSLNNREMDTLKSYLNRIYRFNDTVRNINDGCVDGVSYDLTIAANGKIYDLGNTICDEETIVDRMVLFILSTSINKNKVILFKNYLEYEKIQSGFDSILNQNM